MITLLANLNARSSQPSSDSAQAIERVAIRRPNTSGGVLSFLRSVARAIRHDPTPATNEDRSGIEEGVCHDEEAEDQDAGHAGEPGSIHEIEEVEIEEVQTTPAEQGCLA